MGLVNDVVNCFLDIAYNFGHCKYRYARGQTLGSDPSIKYAV